MNYQTVLWILFGILLITFSIVRKKRNKKLNTTLWILMIFIFLGQTFLPRQLFGKWNSISKLDGKKITEILLQPSEPNWEVNLVGKDFLISNKKQIDTITAMLQKAEVYFPGHPSRIWETRIVFITSDKDGFKIEIHQKENNCKYIYQTTNELRSEESRVGKECRYRW